MTSHDEMDRRLTAWLDEEAAPYAPRGFSETVTEAVQATRRSPGWATLERWIPMETRAQFGAVPRAIIVLTTLVLLTALAAGTFAVGASLLREVPKPFGNAGNGLIAFESDGHIFVVDPDVKTPRPITTGPAEYGAASWSRDGTQLAYWRFPDSEPPQLFITDATGNDPRMIAEDPGTDGEPDVWSEDGKSIMFSTKVPGLGSRLYVAATDGSTGAVQVGDPDLEARSPALSPDGSTVAFGGGRGGAEALYLMQWDGTNVRRLDGVQRTGTWAFIKQSWSADGLRIATNDAGTPQRVWLVDADGSSATQFPDEGIYPSFAPDGTAILWAVFDTGSTIWTPGEPPTSVRLPGADSLVWSPDSARLAGVQGGDLIIFGREGEVLDNLGPAADSRPSWQRIAS